MSKKLGTLFNLSDNDRDCVDSSHPDHGFYDKIINIEFPECIKDCKSASCIQLYCKSKKQSAADIILYCFNAMLCGGDIESEHYLLLADLCINYDDSSHPGINELKNVIADQMRSNIPRKNTAESTSQTARSPDSVTGFKEGMAGVKSDIEALENVVPTQVMGDAGFLSQAFEGATQLMDATNRVLKVTFS